MHTVPSCSSQLQASILMLIGSLRGVKTGCICNVDNYIFERELAGGKYEPNRSMLFFFFFRLLFLFC
jgi:hypothetical protein